MLNGIYHVTFSSSYNDFGEGVAVFKERSINGADYGYFYVGTQSEHVNGFSATLAIKQWNPSVESVFGPAKEFVLEVSGSSSDDQSFVAQGNVVGQPQAKITIRGKYLSAAV